MLTTALLPFLSAPLEPMHAQYVPALTDIAPLLLIRELPQDEYPTPALPRPFTSHDVEPVMFGQTEHQWNNRGVMDFWRRGLPKNRRRLLFRWSALGEHQG